MVAKLNLISADGVADLGDILIGQRSRLELLANLAELAVRDENWLALQSAAAIVLGGVFQPSAIEEKFTARTQNWTLTLTPFGLASFQASFVRRGHGSFLDETVPFRVLCRNDEKAPIIDSYPTLFEAVASCRAVGLQD